ncbi:MAG: adenylate/guanylate cyclase domain-containing protein, partial [Pseudodonghicola sp.]
MTDTAGLISPSPVAARDRHAAAAVDVPDKYTEAALERHKREGLKLAMRVRVITMPMIGLLLLLINPQVEVLFYHAILAFLALNGWLIYRIGRVGRSRLELALIFADLAVMTVGMVMPNPLSDQRMPLAMQYWYDNFLYFFGILAAGTLAFSWRTVIAIGIWTSAMWAAALGIAWWVATPYPDLTEATRQAFAGYPELIAWLDPNNFQIRLRVQEIAVFLIVAVTLAFSARRFNRLLIDNAGLERERANLSRYFSPNVVDELSQNDQPLKQVRR